MKMWDWVLFGPDGTILRRFLRGNEISPLMEEILFLIL